MKKVYGYIRVSTQKQGEGVSLDVQKSDIIRFAKAKNLKIINWFAEKKSASKGFRPEFNQMMEKLYNKEAGGFVAHKIDRMMRNRHDWATINDLMDNGVSVYSADGTTMDDVNGRFMGDIQAAVATRYSSNLSQEAKKGIYGRLKQGLFPFKAPVGYIDNGKGKIKTVDPIQSSLVKKLFELYVTGKYNARTLSKKMQELGLKNSRGNRVDKNGILKILKNPFYIGIMKIKGKTFKGKHEAIIDTRLFNQVQKIIAGRISGKGLKHFYLFRKQIRCENCNYVMTGEKQKGHVYYRCQTKGCPTKSIREDFVETYVMDILKTISLSKNEIRLLKDIHSQTKVAWIDEQNRIERGYILQIKQTEAKEQKLLDAYLENLIEKREFEERKQKLLFKIRELEEAKEKISNSKDTILSNIDNFLELCKSPLKLYKSGIQEEKRELLEIITSNLHVNMRKISFSMVSPFDVLANRDVLFFGGHIQDTHRKLYQKIVYSNINTSPIIPRPLKKEQIKEFFNYLLEIAPSLSIPNNINTEYEIPKNNPSTQ